MTKIVNEYNTIQLLLGHFDNIDYRYPILTVLCSRLWQDCNEKTIPSTLRMTVIKIYSLHIAEMGQSIISQYSCCFE